MEFINDLESGTSPRIRKAAEAIYRSNLQGYCSYLLQALIKEIEKPKAWKTQSILIKALSSSNCVDALPTLRQLVTRTYESTVLYKELGFAIFVLENVGELNLEFLYQSIHKGNVLQICGACAGILFKKITPPNEDIRKIIDGIAPYTQNEGQIITPRCYIAAVAHLWPKEETREFLQSCKLSAWKGLVEISDNALDGKESKIQLI